MKPNTQTCVTCGLVYLGITAVLFGAGAYLMAHEHPVAGGLTLLLGGSYLICGGCAKFCFTPKHWARWDK